MLAAALVLLPLGTLACGGDDDDDPTGPSNAPASHTLSKDGVRHLPGLEDPETNCVACHGADLRGGAAPSCFTCHGQEWP
jgi:hypothetical protein